MSFALASCASHMSTHCIAMRCGALPWHLTWAKTHAGASVPTPAPYHRVKTCPASSTATVPQLSCEPPSPDVASSFLACSGQSLHLPLQHVASWAPWPAPCMPLRTWCGAGRWLRSDLCTRLTCVRLQMKPRPTQTSAHRSTYSRWSRWWLQCAEGRYRAPRRAQQRCRGAYQKKW